MKHLKLLIMIAPLSLSGCAAISTEKVGSAPTEQMLSPIRSSQNIHLPNSKSDFMPDTLHNALPLERNINFYVRGMMQDLINNLQFVTEKTPVAVTSFVMLDTDFTESTLLGNQIAESLIHEIHKFGIPVIDFKTSSEIITNEQGDYIFSRNPTHHSNELPIHYVFGGTMVKHQGGYLINARVIGLNSKAVVASAQSFIPAQVGNALIQQESKHQRKAKKKINLVQDS